MIGREVLNYIIESKIGEGGMAIVYKARHKTLQHTYRAIKVLNPALAMDSAIKAKFVAEAQTMSTLTHPNIVKVYDYHEQGTELFLIMEFVEGHSLDFLLKNITGPLPDERVKKLFSSILDGLGYAHEHKPNGIVHRDIKPSNIIITPNDEPKIIDFGIVKIMESGENAGATKTGTKIGTPIFMSPEQILARSVDKRADIYALGVTLFHMLTGRAPYDSNTLSEFEIQQKIVNDPLPRANAFYPAVSEHMQALIDKATAKKKEERFQDCTEFKMALMNDKFRQAQVSTDIIKDFSADKIKLKKGESTILRWEVHGVDNCVITGLGTTKNLKSNATVSPTSSTTYLLKAGTEERPLYIEVASVSAARKKIAAAIVGGLILIGGISYGINYANTNTYSDTTTTTDTTVLAPVTVSNTPDEPASNTPQTADIPLPTAPATPTSNESSTSEITDHDREVINAVMANRTSSFNGEISEARIEEICALYSYPVSRYYNTTNSDYQNLRLSNVNYYTKSIRQARWNVDNEKSGFKKNADGSFDIEIYGDYYFYYQLDNTKHDPTQEYHLLLHNHYTLNNNYKITEEYEVSRQTP